MMSFKMNTIKKKRGKLSINLIMLTEYYKYYIGILRRDRKEIVNQTN